MTAQNHISKARFESLRVPIDCAVDLRFESSSVPKRMIAANISMSGMFIRGSDMYASGTVCEVQFALREDQPSILGQAEVLWCRDRDKGPNRPKGIGIRFLDLDLESKYQISRLVDQYIQMDELPFQLATSDVSSRAEPTLRPVSRLALLLPLVFLAGLAMGSIGSLWLVQPSAPLEAGFTADSPRAFASRPPSNAGRPAMMADTAETKVLDDVAAVVEAWAAAWAEKKVDLYLGFYSEDFKPGSDTSIEAWTAQRRQRLARPGSIAVDISSVEVEIQDARRASVRFDQAFTSPGYRDRVKKELELVREQRWRIVRERSIAPADG